ncbi:hypothetical protein QAD02_001908 [Eretmocerus hayati]|uniref:Uncharacterized protein n=1 Tax=Eretmocerus hayati TaxID=131215 RepID=A0ACC2NHQ0_9HYME|nr:hypothetical protein QAD02_001908 [Eretmocerus hayati]
MDSPRTPKATSLSAELKELIEKRNMLTTRTRMKVLSALDDLNRENSMKREQSLKSQTIQEILSSEVKYLGQLEIIKEYFMKPMLEKKLLSQTAYTTLFENIDTLYNVNGELLRELKQNPENVANAFCKLAPFLKLYSVYAYNYKRALVLLQDIQQNDPVTSEFISNQETRPEVGNKLSALLIAPIQRVPRYRLLLQEVIRHTLPRQKEYNDLQASLVEIEKVASHINALVAEYEDTQKLLELQKRISGRGVSLVKPGRKLIRQGPLMRVSRRGNSSFRRHFVLLSDTLLYCKGEPDSSLTVCCLLPLNKCQIERVLSNGLFKVTCMHENLLLYSENGDSEDWIQALQDAVKKYIECRQTLRKDSSSRIPMRKIIRLDNDDVVGGRRKRKRPVSTSDAVEANNSNIIYVNRDTESEGPSGGLNFFLALKRFKKGTDETKSSPRSKKNSSDIELTPVSGRVKKMMDEMKKNDSRQIEKDNDFFHQTRNRGNTHRGTTDHQASEGTGHYEQPKNDNVPEVLQQSEDGRLLSVKSVSKLFTSIGNTVRDLFSWN